MTDRAASTAQGRTKPQHLLILASGDKVRHMAIRPWLAVVFLSAAGLFSIGSIGATAYLLLRDARQIDAAAMRHMRMRDDYEERIAALRAEIDRITAGKQRDRKAVENKVERLLARQEALLSPAGRSGNGYELDEDAAAALSNAFAPERKTGGASGSQAIELLLKPSSDMPPLDSTSAAPAAGGKGSDRVLTAPKDIKNDQTTRIAAMAAGAQDKADAMAAILRRTGIRLEDTMPGGIGGPFMEPEADDGDDPFERSLDGLDNALQRLDMIRMAAEALPLSSPAPGHGVSSRFGNRIDPFFGRLALHAGVDFQAETGTGVQAAGAGTVVFAGYSGNYGNLVEIDHGKGLTSRYAHMSQVSVKDGQRLAAGDTIGKSGNTGRSTGPHVHYEVRLNDRPVDPMRFLAAGLELRTHL